MGKFMKNGNKKYTEEEFKKAVLESFSIAETLRKLNLQPKGGNYKTFKRNVQIYNINFDHFLGQRQGNSKIPQSVLETRRLFTLRPCEEVFIENSDYNPSSLKQRILKDKILEYKCAICNLDTWREQPISLHLDHINGINNDNRLENLRFLCPNCHSQTPTYCRGSKGLLPKVNIKASTFKINWPDNTQLKYMLLENNNNISKLSRILGVSDNAVRKRIKTRNLLDNQPQT